MGIGEATPLSHIYAVVKDVRVLFAKQRILNTLTILVLSL
jgi:hypothetical protein